MGRYKNWPLIINLGNSIIGVSILAMPFCFKQCGIFLGMLTLLFCCWLTLCSSSLLMKAGIISRRSSYEFLAYHTHGATGKFVSEIGMIGMQMGTLIAQIVVVGDLAPPIVSKLLGLENTDNLRSWLLICLCLGVGLPMGLLKDLRSVSRGSTLCIMFYCGFVAYVLIMSIPNLWSGDWYFKVNFWRPQGLFQCLPILSFSFGCQTQLFLVYEELPEPSLKDISGVISSAVNLCSVAYLLVGFFGYITFHAIGVPGDILAVFPSTPMADLTKLCFVFSIVITFPVIIFPCRASIYTLLFAKKAKAYDDSLEESTSYIPENIFKTITFFIILSSMITGILIPNVEFILGMNGAIMGTLICYIFPALFFIKVVGNKAEGRAVAQLVLFLGVTILLVSTFATLSSQDKGHTHLDNVQEVPMANPNVLEINEVANQVPAWQEKAQVKPDIASNEVLAKDVPVKEEELVVEKRKEPPIPDPPMSDDKDKPDKVESKDTLTKKKNGSAVKIKAEDDLQVKTIDEAKLEAKEKKLEEAHKAKELELKEKEKKQEEILMKLEKHKEDQEHILKEQIAVLKELKDHKEKDKNKEVSSEKEVEEKEKVKENVKDVIVKKQQELLNQQQQVNQLQQALIIQQQQQLNEVQLKQQGLNQGVGIAQQQGLNQGLNAQQQGLNQGVGIAQQQGLNQGLNSQQQGLNQGVGIAQQQGLNQGLNAQQQGLNQGVGIAQQQGLNQGVGIAQQQGLNQGLNTQQQALNQGVGIAQQQGLNQGVGIAQQQGLNQGVGIAQQQGLNQGVGIAQQQGLNQGVGIAQQRGLNQGLNAQQQGLKQG